MSRSQLITILVASLSAFQLPFSSTVTPPNISALNEYLWVISGQSLKLTTCEYKDQFSWIINGKFISINDNLIYKEGRKYILNNNITTNKIYNVSELTILNTKFENNVISITCGRNDFNYSDATKTYYVRILDNPLPKPSNLKRDCRVGNQSGDNGNRQRDQNKCKDNTDLEFFLEGSADTLSCKFVARADSHACEGHEIYGYWDVWTLPNNNGNDEAGYPFYYESARYKCSLINKETIAEKTLSLISNNMLFAMFGIVPVIIVICTVLTINLYERHGNYSNDSPSSKAANNVENSSQILISTIV